MLVRCIDNPLESIPSPEFYSIPSRSVHNSPLMTVQQMQLEEDQQGDEQADADINEVLEDLEAIVEEELTQQYDGICPSLLETPELSSGLALSTLAYPLPSTAELLQSPQLSAVSQLIVDEERQVKELVFEVTEDMGITQQLQKLVLEQQQANQPEVESTETSVPVEEVSASNNSTPDEFPSSNESEVASENIAPAEVVISSPQIAPVTEAEFAAAPAYLKVKLKQHE